MSSSKPSIAELRPVCQPPAVLGRRSEEHWAGRLYARRVSLHVTRRFLGWGMSADGVTVLMLLIGLGGAGLLFVGGVWPAVAALVAIQAYLLLDCVDGEVARWRRTESARGVYLDRVSHYLVEGLLLVAVGWRAGGDSHPVWLAVGLGGALAVVLGRVETDLIDAARAKAGMDAIGDSGSGVRPRPLRWARRVFDFFPIHRITGAVEASVLVAVAAVVDAARGDLGVSRVLLIVVGSVAAMSAAGHLVLVLASDRLR